MQLPDDIARDANSIATSFNESVTAVRSNPNLSAAGRISALATLWVPADQAMAALRERYSGGKTKNRNELFRKLFANSAANSGDAISARDADDRAAQLADPDAALDLLERAEQNGDQVLVRAIAMRAYRETSNIFGGARWAAVLDAYVVSRPALAALIGELSQYLGGSLQNSLVNDFTLMLVKPTELEPLSDWEIAGLAAGGDAAPYVARVQRR